MADNALYAGPALRRLRRGQNLTQAAMAGRLEISSSYLNLIERNQRPVTARVLVQLMNEFGFDPRSLEEQETVGGVEGLARRFTDGRFADLGIDREELDEFLWSSPQIATAFARLYDKAGPRAESEDDPLVAARREIERWRNHFSDLDHAAEALADEMRLSRSDITVALTERLREKHQLSVRILPRDVMPDATRRLDLHARQVQLSEMLSAESRAFQLAVQLTRLEQREPIANLAGGVKFPEEAARELFARHLIGYFAAALIMPYGRFLRACEATGYDLPVLQRRFGVSFEHLAHRLTTLQRVGQRGLPFFMARLDRGGQYSKRLSGASGALFFEGEHPCPLWSATRAFGVPGELQVESISLGDGGGGPADWFTMCSTVTGSGALQKEASFVVVLGVETRLAPTLAQARGKLLENGEATPIGPGCRLCHRQDCRQRSVPPAGRPLSFDDSSRGVNPFGFARSAS